MKIAIVTGASSGLGRELAEYLGNNERLDEIWVIARREERLKELKSTIKIKVVPLELDLCNDNDVEIYRRKLADEAPEVRVLVNAAGCGRFGTVDTHKNSEQLHMIDLNVRALTEITMITAKYMERGSCIYQFSSLSAFLPLPYMSVYAATKAYVLSFSRSLNVELKPRGIRVMAVCPSWVRTEFIDRAEDENGALAYYDHIYEPRDVIKRAVRDMKKGKDVSVYGAKPKILSLASRLVSHRYAMKKWCKLQKKHKR